MSLVNVGHAVDRGVGELAAVDALPTSVVALARLLTRLGDPATLLVVVAGAYLLATRIEFPPARMATVLALALGSLSVTLALKHAFALPRPPGAGIDGYGFPSGHALGATVVYGGLAALDRRRWPVAIPLIAVVACSRLVIGVHYLVDVVAGVALGVGYLALALHLGAGWHPDRVAAADARRLFALGVGLAIAALGVAVVRETVVALGAAVGGWVGWRFAAGRTGGTTTTRFVGALAVLPVVLVAVGTLVDGGVSTPLAAVLAGAVVTLLLALPGLGAKKSDRVA